MRAIGRTSASYRACVCELSGVRLRAVGRTGYATTKDRGAHEQLPPRARLLDDPPQAQLASYRAYFGGLPGGYIPTAAACEFDETSSRYCRFLRMPRPHLTRLQRTNRDGFPKPGELIEIAGAHELEAPDRAILNLLYQHAHDSGRLTDRDAEWVLPLGELRRALSKHQSNDAVRASLAQLMKVRVKVSYTSAECPVCGQEQKPGDPRTLTTHLLDYIDTSDENDGKATVKFGLPKMLVPILAESKSLGAHQS